MDKYYHFSFTQGITGQQFFVGVILKNINFFYSSKHFFGFCGKFEHKLFNIFFFITFGFRMLLSKIFIGLQLIRIVKTRYQKNPTSEDVTVVNYQRKHNVYTDMVNNDTHRRARTHIHTQTNTTHRCAHTQKICPNYRKIKRKTS